MWSITNTMLKRVQHWKWPHKAGNWQQWMTNAYATKCSYWVFHSRCLDQQQELWMMSAACIALYVASCYLKRTLHKYKNHICTVQKGMRHAISLLARWQDKKKTQLKRSSNAVSDQKIQSIDNSSDTNLRRQNLGEDFDIVNDLRAVLQLTGKMPIQRQKHQHDTVCARERVVKAKTKAVQMWLVRSTSDPNDFIPTQLTATKTVWWPTGARQI